MTLTGAATSTADVISTIGTGGTVTGFRIRNAGVGYTVAPTVGITTAPGSGTSDFISNETVTGSLSGTTARVKKYDKDAKTLDVYINSGKFTDLGETIVNLHRMPHIQFLLSMMTLE